MHRFPPLLVALSLSATGASAQSVLERVLGQIDGASNLAQVNGTYANIAESIATPTISSTETVLITESQVGSLSNAPGDTELFRTGIAPITVSDIGKTFTAGDGTAVGNQLEPGQSITVNADGSLSTVVPESTTLTFNTPDGNITLQPGDTAVAFPEDAKVYFKENVGFSKFLSDEGTGFWGYNETHLVFFDVVTDIIVTPGSVSEVSTTIDGSITNIVTGVATATEEAFAGVATATEFTLPTLDLGDMATTALGAVNTGDITLGVNAAVDEASTRSTGAISVAMTQIGGSADTGALVLNVASNTSAVNGSIQTTLLTVDGSIGNLSTTALGAVNTGTITSGVNAAVQGLVGRSGQ